MRERLLDILCCPGCRQALEISVYAQEKNADGKSISGGLLRCRCGLKFPVWQGVPQMLIPGDRMIHDDYLRTFERRLRVEAPDFYEEHARQPAKRSYTFDLQWGMYEYSQLTWEVDLATRVNHVYHFVGIPKGSLSSSLVLDAGCGNGTLSAGLAQSGPEVVGMDYSDVVVRAEAQKQRFAREASGRVHYVQGSVLRPPFRPETFDLVYCDGVLHHTQNTRTSFCVLAPLVKPGGRYFVMLYRDKAPFPFNWKFRIVKTLQKVLRPLPLRMMQSVCFAGAALLLARRRVLQLFGNRKRPLVPLRLRAVNLFDTLTPRYYHLHTPLETEQWFLDEGFCNPVETSVPPLSDSGFAMVAVKPKTQARATAAGLK